MSPGARRELSPLFTWRGAVASRHSDLPPVSRHVALTLSLHMSEKGDSAFPGDELLGEETGLSRGTIRTHRHLLVERGWLVLGEQGGGRGRANKYRATIPESYWDSVDADRRGQESTGSPSRSPEETGQEKTGYVMTPLPETGHLTNLNRSSDKPKPVTTRPPGRKEVVIEDVRPESLPSAEEPPPKPGQPSFDELESHPDLAEKFASLRAVAQATAPKREADRAARRARQ